MKRIYIILFFFYTALYGSSHVDYQSLSKNKKWIALLHFDKQGKQSSVKSKAFFLSPYGDKDPYAELLATIQAYKRNNRKILCRYPARFFWLSKKLHWQHFQPCTDYKKWSITQNTTSLSLFFVSGFLGNPASAFGHSFLKLNTQKEHTLLNNTISFGAKLPPQYTMLSYIYNGITGGYQGAYTDEYFYMNDMMYSNQEFRKMWEYKLNISYEKLSFLLMHLWELRGVEFPYYFFNRNCGYHLSELIDLLYEKKIKEDAYLWYAPVETFYQLEEIDNSIKTIVFHTSLEDKVYAFYHSLHKTEKEFIKAYLKDLHTPYHQLPVSSRIKVYDFLLEFLTYQMQISDKDSKQYRQFQFAKYDILQKRLLLPPSRYRQVHPKRLPPITQSSSPSRISLAYHHTPNAQSVFIGFVPFAIEALSKNTHDGDILKVLDLTVSIDRNAIDLTQADIIKIRHLDTGKLPFDIANQYSWALHIGMKQQETGKEYFAKASAGYTWKLSENAKFFSMLEFSLHSKAQPLRLQPYIGLWYHLSSFKASFQYGIENRNQQQWKDPVIDIQLQYQLQKNHALFIQWEHQDITSVTGGFKWYF